MYSRCCSVGMRQAAARRRNFVWLSFRWLKLPAQRAWRAGTARAATRCAAPDRPASGALRECNAAATAAASHRRRAARPAPAMLPARSARDSSRRGVKVGPVCRHRRHQQGRWTERGRHRGAGGRRRTERQRARYRDRRDTAGPATRRRLACIRARSLPVALAPRPGRCAIVSVRCGALRRAEVARDRLQSRIEYR